MPKNPPKARATASKRASKRSPAALSFTVSKEGLEPILGAAYLMTDEAFVSLSGDKSKKLAVSLAPKPGSALGQAELEARFRAELAAQKVRWAIAKNNQPIREFIAEQAVLLANGRLEAEPEPAAADALSEEQRKEIEKLIAEVEDEIKTLNDKKSAKDPKNLSASWEARQEGAPETR